MTYKEYVASDTLIPFYTHWRLYPKDNNYHLCFSYKLKDDKEINSLTDALQQLIEKQSYLRQTFDYKNEKIIARIHNYLPAQLNFFNILMDDFARIEQQLIIEPHDLNHTSSIKLNIIRFKDSGSCVALFNIHHILMDATSLECFIHDLNKMINQENCDFESAENYILHNAQENQDRKNDHLNIDHYLNGINRIASHDGYPSIEHIKSEHHYTIDMDSEQMKLLRQFSAQHHISIFNILLLVYALFIQKMFHLESSIVNYPVNSRKNKLLAGAFVRMVPFALSVNSEDTFLTLIETHLTNIPLLKVIAHSKLNMAATLQHAPNFSVSLMAHPDELRIGDEIYVAKTYAQIASGILSIKYREYGDRLFFTCDVAQGVFPEHFAQTILSRFILFIAQVLEGSQNVLRDISIISAAEKHDLVFKMNAATGQQVVPRHAFAHKTVHEFVEEYAQHMPDHPAVWWNGHTISYGELNQKSDALAHYLHDFYRSKHGKSLRKDTIIAVMLSRSIQAYIAFLAILKAGAAFLPLDPDDPKERLLFMLQDSQASLLLTNTDLLQAQHIDRASLDVLLLDEQQASMFQPNDAHRLPRTISPNDLAYIMYTSGTTGRPKGVQIQHSGIVNLVKSTNYVQIEPTDRVIQASKLIFDASTFEIWGALLNGATSYLIDQTSVLQPAQLSAYINSHAITILYLTAGLFHEIVSQNCATFSGLKCLYVGGEPVRPELVKKLFSYPNASKLTFTNGYGPTECTTFSTTYTMTTMPETLKSIPIGKPISGVACYILDADARLVPFGMVGELCIGGPGVARGYLNHSDLTHKKFIPNLFIPGQKMYRTGDLARYLQDGNIELLGRVDRQIKIRGYRIELEEIELYLGSYSNVRRAVVTIKNDENGQKWLVAYVVAQHAAVINLDALTAYLKTCLPAYMIPTFYVPLTHIPLTPNGKIDYSALPKAQYAHIYPKPIYRECSASEIDERIITIWKETLGLEHIGMDDNFFDVGGNSLLLMRLQSKLEEVLNKKIPSSALFLHTTIRAHSHYFSNQNKRAASHLERARARAQQRLKLENNAYESGILS